MKNTLQPPRIGWIDLLRIAACFCVVLGHCCDPFVSEFDLSGEPFLTGVTIGSLMRPSVPLFVMISGALLLPIGSPMSLGAFYRKRIGRILRPLIFWSLALPLLFFGYLHGVDPSTGNPSIASSDHTLPSLWTKLYTFVFNFNFDTVPLWYLYMLIGLYLILPLLSAWIKSASRRDVELLLGIWGISLFLPYLQMVAPALGYAGNWGNMGIWGVCDWNSFGTLYYLSGFVGYLVLGYYLHTYPLPWSWAKLASIGIPLYLLGYLITYKGFLETQKLFPGDYSKLEVLWLFNGINVACMTVPLFAAFRKWNPQTPAWISRMATLMFGVYLCHFFLIPIFYNLTADFAVPTWVRMAGMACGAFLVSVLISGSMMRFKYTRGFVE